jgi:hypothetical protein
MNYTTWGSVRGGCGHAHGTFSDALACVRQDGSAVIKGHGTRAYSDRLVREIDDPSEATSYDVRRGPGRAPRLLWGEIVVERANANVILDEGECIGCAQTEVGLSDVVDAWERAADDNAYDGAVNEAGEWVDGKPLVIRARRLDAVGGTRFIESYERVYATPREWRERESRR